MNNKQYLGKTNKELIIEVIGEIKGIKKDLKECRPVCFNSENELIKINQKIKDFKWFVTAIASIVTIVLNAAMIFYKKIKGG